MTRFGLDPADAREELEYAIARYLQLGVTPTKAPDAWRRLWDDVARAYREGRISDSDFDALLSRFCGLQ